MNEQALLIIFVKNPEKGHVKTRLAASIGDEKALEIYLQLLAHTRKVTTDLEVHKAVFYSKHIDENDEWPSPPFLKRIQCEGGLGIKMAEAFKQAFQMGYQKVCLIGTDIYELTPEVIEEAFLSLSKHDTVIGPAKDGGYYLIGMKKLHASIFEGKTWSTPTVCQDTIQDIENLGLSCQLVDTLNDIDEFDDLKLTDLWP